MDAKQILGLRPMLRRYLKQFDNCFSRCESREYLSVYVGGQLSELPEKSCEPIALAAGVPPRNLQEFLAHYKWDESRVRQRLQQLIAKEHGGPHTIAIIDETSDVKKGDKTPGVKRQWCGTRGKTENCIVTVHLGYAQGDFHCLLDGDLFLPEDWASDRRRCREAEIPEDVGYRPKWQIAVDLYDRARGNGLSFDWLVCDEGYGGKPEFLRQMHARGQVFVAEVPTMFTGWINAPEQTERPYRRARGRGRKTPRLKSGSRPAIGVRAMLQYSPALRDQPWANYRVKDGEKGPMVWAVKHTMITVKDESGLPGMQLHLVVARNALDHNEIKYFVSNAPPETRVQTLLLVAFSRWRVERCFEDQKQEVGLDQWEGRRWLSLQRHLILTCISYLFLSRTRERLRGEKSRADCLPGPSGRGRARPKLVARPPRRSRRDPTHCKQDPALATTQRLGADKPHQANTPATAENRHQNEGSHPL